MKRIILCLIYLFSSLAQAQISLSTDKGAVVSQKSRVSTQTASDLDNYQNAQTQIKYVDGLGRSLQTLGYRATPTAKDLVSESVHYDGFGRTDRVYLPTPSSTSTGAFVGNVLSQGQTFYVDTHPYTQVKTFDDSPFKQSLEQYGAGQAWQTANPDTKYTKVLHNVATDNEVRWYEIDGSKNIVKNGFYPAHSLTKTTTIDEQEHQTITYTNQGGTLIQKSVQDDTGFLTTYYVLDDLGRIGAVIQPKGYELDRSITYNSAEFEGFVFFYEYNDYNQLVRKHIPSGGWSSMVYDKANRVVLEQDAHQAILNKWSFMVYDVLGRLVSGGELNNNSSRETLQNTFDSTPAPYASFPVSYNETDVKYGNLYDNYNWIAGEWAFNGAVAYNADNYWSNVQGLQTGSFARSNEDNTKVFHTVMHYDKKGRVMQTYQVHHKGGSTPWTKTIITNYEYNFAGEVTKEKVLYQIDGLANTEAITSHEYDHTGRILKIFHGINATPTEIIKMDYDELGRLLQKKFLPNGTYIAGGVKEYINRPNPDGIVTQNNTQDVARKAIILWPNSIDAINLTTYSARIDTNATGGTNISGLQTMNYRWHIRGGLLGINLDNSGNATPQASEGDLFSYKLEYETAGLYDGNIGKQSWQTTDNKNTALGIRAYTYTYDVSSRLKSASFSGLNGENFSLPSLSYDKNGNIENLQRKGKKGNVYDNIDNLSYNYAGNKLTSVTDGISGNHEVDFVPRGSGAYTYYPNGALKSDENEQITNIIYDTFLKQPIEVVLSDGRKIKHFYDGLGRLFKTVYYSDATTVLETWDFIGGIILKNGQFYQMATPEGRAIFLAGAWQYEFDYKDHLGNTRVSFKANGNNLEKNSETAFDPFGVRLPIGVNNAFQNRFEMQGKESEKTFGLNRINLGARTVNPTIGRMDRVDMMAEKFLAFTPYNYTLNNPIAIIDPDGNESSAYGGFTSQEDIEFWRNQKTQEFFDRRDETSSQDDSEGEDPPKKLSTGQRIASFGFGVLNTAGAAASAAYIVGTDGVGAAAGGYLALTYNVDHAATNFAEAWTGEAQETNGSKLLQAAGVSKESATTAYNTAGILMMKPAGGRNALLLTTSSISKAPSRTYTIYQANGDLFKFGVTDANFVRMNQSLKLAGNGSYAKWSGIITKQEAHIAEKYLRSLHFNSTGQYILPGMKVPYPINFNTGLPIKKP
jgi:RHS repeat-associated protein